MKSNKWIFPVSILALALAACSGGGGDNKGGQSKSVIDTSSCTGAPAAGATIYSSWYQTLQDKSGQQNMKFTISQDTLTESVTCVMNGSSATATATAQVRITGSQIVVLQGAQDSGSAPTPEGYQTCEVNIPTGATLNYQLVGNCLNLSAGNESYMFVH